jgi:hypothetical protein
MTIPITADAPRLPNSLITKPFALLADDPLGALPKRLPQRGVVRLALEPRAGCALARSLSIAERQIVYVNNESNQSAVNRLSRAVRFGTLSIHSFFWSIS